MHIKPNWEAENEETDVMDVEALVGQPESADDYVRLITHIRVYLQLEDFYSFSDTVLANSNAKDSKKIKIKSKSQFQLLCMVD